MKYLLYTRNLDTWNLAATTKAHDKAFSLIELLVVIAIMAILAAIMVVSGSALHNQALEKETKTTLQVYVDCLNIYKQEKDKRDGHFQFPPSPDMITKITGQSPGSPEALLQCFLDESFNDSNHILCKYLGYEPPRSIPVPKGTAIVRKIILPNLLRANYSKSMSENSALILHNGLNLWTDDGLSNNDILDRWAAIASFEVLKIYLSEVPRCREIFNRIPGGAENNLDGDSIVLFMGLTSNVAGQRPLAESYDAWRCPLLYRNNGKGRFPTIISAGKDGIFNTADDIYSADD